MFSEKKKKKKSAFFVILIPQTVTLGEYDNDKQDILFSDLEPMWAYMQTI